VTARYLLDTSVVSLLAPDKVKDAKEFVQWIRERENALFLSVVTIAEIEQGISKLNRSGRIERAERLAVWLDELLQNYGGRVLAVDTAVARVAGEISLAAANSSKRVGLAEILIAATARVHNALLLTRKGKHFAPLGVDYIDPA
jgi:hypothetical protein